jgi:hypothetical protein
MVYWAIGLLVVFAVAHKLRRLKVLHLEWGLVRLEFEPEGSPRHPREPKDLKKIED